jgi:hypothetical protein
MAITYTALVDLLIWAGFWVALACGASFVAWLSKRRAKAESPAEAPVPVAVRLQDDHRRRVSGTHVSAVRPSDERLARWELSPRQRAAIAEGKKRKL